MERTPRVALRSPCRHDQLRGLSLCAGVGGLDLGIHLAEPGYHTVGFVERDSFAAATLVARMADATLAPAVVWDDLRSFDGKPWRGRVSVVSAGYPCQPFSYSGHRKGEDDPRHLWPEVARIVAEVAPEWCFFENVPGHLSLGLRDVASDLQRLGYRIAAGVVSAAEVGGSHIRDRLFILAHADPNNVGEPGLHPDHTCGPRVSPGFEPDRQTDRLGQRSSCLVADVGYDAGSGLDTCDTPRFPPMPGDFAQWGSAISDRPDLKPCVHGLADGVAPWVERSMCAGNGVVPLAAAHAWRMLKAELTGEP